MATIEELLKSLQMPGFKTRDLVNSKETWERIGKQDAFSELGLESSELSSFLSEWIADNPYNSI